MLPGIVIKPLKRFSDEIKPDNSISSFYIDFLGF